MVPPVLISNILGKEFELPPSLLCVDLELDSSRDDGDEEGTESEVELLVDNTEENFADERLFSRDTISTILSTSIPIL